MKCLIKRSMTLWLSVVALACMAPVTAGAKAINGEAGFKEHCSSCHADGGNIIKADRTLSRKDREKHGIKTANDIVKLMRKPGEGMTTFDKKTVPDKEARAIADYNMKTFK